MKADGIARLYDTLTVDERFRLRTQAFARRDMVDCERLDRSCPSTDYREYCARIEASDVLTLCTLVDLMPTLAKMDMVDAVRPVIEHLEGKIRDAAWLGYLDGYEAGWRAAGRRGDAPDVSDDDLRAVAEQVTPSDIRFSNVLDQIQEFLASRARTTRDGLAIFADERLGLSPDILLGAWGPPSLIALANHAEALDAAAVDTDELTLFTRVLDLAWRKHGLLDRKAEPDGDLREIAENRGW